MLSLSTASTEYVKVPVFATVGGNPNYDPTVDVVAFAFLTSGQATPVSGDFHTGSWETQSIPVVTHFARILVGPTGGLALAAATYNVWLKITDSPEIPVLFVGQMQVS